MLSLRVALRGRRADRHRRGPAPRRRPGPDAAVRRLRGHARDHHARDARDRPAAGRAPVRDARVRERRRRRRGLPRDARRRLPAVGDPHVRRGGDPAHAVAGRRGDLGRRVRRRLLRGGARRPWPSRGPAPSSSRARRARASSIPPSPSAGGTAATTSTSRPTTPSCPRSGARSTSSRPTRGSAPSTARWRPRCATATRPTASSLRMHYSHWYRWGTMIYARFLVPEGDLELHDRIWHDGITAVLEAGGVMNDHHGVGLKLAPVHGRPARPRARRAANDQARTRPARHHEPREAGAVRRRAMSMKVSMHNWMRPEPIEATIERLARLGYDGLEISGEPQGYDAAQVRSLLDEHGLECWGAVTLMTGGRDLLHEDPYVRLGSVQYVKDCLSFVAALGRQDRHGRAVDGRQDRADGVARRRVAVGRRGPPGVPGARGGGRRADRPGAAQPLRDLLPQPLRAGARARRRGRRRLRRRARHVPHEHRGGRPARGDPRSPATGSSTSTSPTTTACRPGYGALDWDAIVRELQGIGYDGHLTVEFVPALGPGGAASATRRRPAAAPASRSSCATTPPAPSRRRCTSATRRTRSRTCARRWAPRSDARRRADRHARHQG